MKTDRANLRSVAAEHSPLGTQPSQRRALAAGTISPSGPPLALFAASNEAPAGLAATRKHHLPGFCARQSCVGACVPSIAGIDCQLLVARKTGATRKFNNTAGE